MMAIRILAGALLTAVLLMVFGFVFWMFLPIADKVMYPLPPAAVDAVVPQLTEMLDRPGLYMYPCPQEVQHAADPQAAQEEVSKKFLAGPLVQIMYRREGAEMMSPVTYAAGFAQFFAIALVAGLLLAQAGRGLLTFGARLCVVLLAGVLGVILIDLAGPIWFHHPWNYSLMLAGYHVANVLIVAVVMSALVRPLPTMPRGSGC